MQYIVLDFSLHGKDPTISIGELSLYQLDSHHVDGKLLLTISMLPSGVYEVQFLDRVEVVETFGQAWIHCLQQIANHIVILFDQKHKHHLDVLVEQSGYIPIEDQSILFVSWLSQLILPQIAQRELSSIYQALYPHNESHHSNNEMIVAVLKGLLSKLAVLPDITLRSISTSKPESTISRVIQAVLADRTLERTPKTLHKVIEDIAFTVAPEDITDEDYKVPADTTTESLAHQSLTMLRTHFKAIGDFPYESRQGQEHMMELVANALDTRTHLIVEAGTGTGKSLAYLLPSALFTHAEHEKVVVATHTIALQEQLYKHDVPLVLEPLMQGIRTAVLKGRNNYICMRKLSQNIHEIQALASDERDYDLRLAVWLTKTETGDREEIAFTEHEEGYWRDVASETNSCIAKHCPFFKDCYYFRARHKAAKADLILTNHSLVLSDIKADSRVLPAYDRLIIDEAHQLEDVATKQFGAQVAEGDLQRLLERLLNARNGLLHDAERSIQVDVQKGMVDGQVFATVLTKLGRALLRTSQDIRTLFSAIAMYTDSLGNLSGEFRLTPERTNAPAYEAVIRAASDIDVCRSLLTESLTAYAVLSEETELPDAQNRKLADVFGYARELQQGLTICVDVLLLRLSADQFVGWIAINGRRVSRKISLHLAPLSVSEVLLQELFRKKQSVILTSATLAVANSFHYFLGRIGMKTLVEEGKAKTEIVTSPFNYKKQSLLCVVSDLPDSKQQEEFQTEVGKAITKIATVAHGRTLVLFTSHQMLAQTYVTERDSLQKKGITVLAQGFDDHRKTYLIETFRKEPRAVLFGVNSFWEGIDIRGDDLSCLIIVKLPFAVPTHPIVEARSELLTRLGKRPFIDYSVPSAAIRFTQGFGRLIRSKTDRGVVFVLDKRITQTKYGRMFIRSLPDPDVYEGTLNDTCAKAMDFLDSTQQVYSH